jgi:hypothetical protein
LESEGKRRGKKGKKGEEQKRREEKCDSFSSSTSFPFLPFVVPFPGITTLFEIEKGITKEETLPSPLSSILSERMNDDENKLKGKNRRYFN